MTAEFTLTVAILLLALAHFVDRPRATPRWVSTLAGVLRLLGLAYALAALWALTGGAG